MIGARTLCLVAALAMLCCIVGCGDDSDSGVSRFEVSYFIPDERDDIEFITTTINYAGAVRPLADPTGVPATCRSVGNGAVVALDLGDGRILVDFCGCAAGDLCIESVDASCGATDSDPAIGAGDGDGDGVVGPRHAFDCEFEIVGVAPDEYFAANRVRAFDILGEPVPSTELGTIVRMANPPPPPDPLPEDAEDYDVTASIVNEAGLIGALQFDIQHLGERGGWRGAGGGVRCGWQVSGGITACNDVGSGHVRCALADISGFTTPADIVACVFATDEEITTDSFEVTVIDASTPDFEPSTVEMEITSVEPR